MSREELQQAAIACLAKAFQGDAIEPHIVQAAVSVLLIQESPYKKNDPDGRSD